MNRAPAPEDLSPTEEVVEQNSGAAEFASRRGRETGAIISYRAVSRTPMGVCPTALQVVDRTRSVSKGTWLYLNSSSGRPPSEKLKQWSKPLRVNKSETVRFAFPVVSTTASRATFPGCSRSTRPLFIPPMIASSSSTSLRSRPARED
ncbi:hypothetical protein BHE74_00018459 [Ensete ventricosum]|nr:hypothetical protein BHE74_00018459 [Ensete ventricosum]